MLLMSTAPVFGQDNGGGPGGPQGGAPDFAQMRQRMQERLKERLGATDDEWSVLGAKIEAVQQLQRELRPRPSFGPGGPSDNAGPGGGPGDMGPGGPGEPGAPNDDSPVQKAMNELNKVLRGEDVKPDDIKAAIARVRDERAKVRANLTKAQTDLQSVVTAKQEAILLTLGILE
jgi:hypothetical protein